MKKLSIIIPVYNTEAYITTCLDSICSDQDIPSDTYEVLVVNDGSTDGSRQTIVDLQEKYGNIILKDQPNAGQSAARNLALDIAQGEYIVFVDSDDYLEKNCLGQIVNLLESHNPDMLSFCYRHFCEDGTILDTPIPNLAQEVQTFTGHEFLARPDLSVLITCKYAYRNALLREHSIKFYEGIIHEDAELIPRVMLNSKTILHWNKVLYWVLERSGSSIRDPSLFEYRVDSYKKVLLSLLDYEKEHHLPLQGKAALGMRLDHFTQEALRLCLQLNSPQALKDLVSFLKQNNLQPFPYRRWNIHLRASIKNRLKRLKTKVLILKSCLASKGTPHKEHDK